MKALIFDAGPIISLTMNNLLWIIPKLKEHFKGEFYITGAVKSELVDVPLATKKFKFEAIQVIELINSGTLKVIENEFIKNKTLAILGTANNIFFGHGYPIKILHHGEVSMIACSEYLNCDTLVIDEKSTRLLIENPKTLRDILEKTLHMHIDVDNKKLNDFRRTAGNPKIIRSVELASIAYELGILDRFVKGIPNTPNKNNELLEAILWGIKLNGCAVSEKEIRQIVKLEAPKYRIG